MRLSEFRIGAELICGEGRYRCTDLASRVFVAIRVDQPAVTRILDGGCTTSIVLGGGCDRRLVQWATIRRR